MNKLSLTVAALALLLSGAAFAGVKEETSETCSKETYESSCTDNVGRFCSTSKVAGAAEGSTTVWTLTCGAGETCTDIDGSIDCRVGKGCVFAESSCDETNPLLGHRCKDGVFSDWTCKSGTKCQEGLKEDGTASPGWLLCVDDGGSSDGCTNAESHCDETNPLLGHRCSNGSFIDWTCKSGTKCQEGQKEDGTASPGWLLCVDDSGSSGDCTNAQSYCDASNPLLGHRCKDGAFVDWTCKSGTKCQAGYKEDGTASAGWLLCVDDDGTDPGTDPDPSTCSQANYCSSDRMLAYNCGANDSLVSTPCTSTTTCQMVGTAAKCVQSIDDNDDDKKSDSGCSATGAGFLFGWLGLALLPTLRRREK